MKTSKKIILLIIHLFITVATIILTLKGVLFGASDGQLGENMINLGYFKAFTIDSNDFTALASLILSIVLIKNLIKKEDKLPKWAVLLHYVSAVAVGLTFVTTMTFLAPTQVSIGNSYWLYFSGDMFFLHFLTPALAIGTYILGDSEYKLSRKENLLGLIPLAIYSCFYVTNVVILKTWSDFYGFTFGGHNEAIIPVLVIIFAVTFGISVLISFIHNKVQKL